MAQKNDLEFVSVDQNEEDFSMNETYPLKGGEGQNLLGNTFLNQSKHPVTAFFHLIFKFLALFIYIFGGWFTESFIMVFVLCILLLACDFWAVKNVTGRLLVGLRWWSYVKEDGSNEWIFESLEDMAEVSAFDSRIFWGGLYVSPALWALLLIIGILRLKIEYLPIIFAALAMNGANIMGYIKCSNAAKEKMRSLVEQGMKQGSLAALDNSSVRNWILNSLLYVTTSTPTQPAQRTPSRSAVV